MWGSGTASGTDAFDQSNPGPFLGVAVSPTARWAVSAFTDDNVATSSCVHGLRTDAVFAAFASSLAYSGWWDLQSFDADGFTLVVRDAMGFAQRVHYLALGGPELQAAVGLALEPSATGLQDVTGVGFEPDVVLMAPTRLSSAPPVTGLDLVAGLGFAAKDGVGAITQACLTTFALHNFAAGNTAGYAREGDVLARVGWNDVSGTQVMRTRALVTTMLADGFRLDWVQRQTTGAQHPYLALKGVKAHVGSVLTQTDTVTQIVETGVGFAPVALLGLTHGQNANASGSPSPGALWGVGAATGPTNRATMAFLDVNNADPTRGYRAVDHDAWLTYIAPNFPGSVEMLLDLVSMDTDGFTAIMDDADAAQRFVGYLALGSTDGEPPPGGTLPLFFSTYARRRRRV